MNGRRRWTRSAVTALIPILAAGCVYFPTLGERTKTVAQTPNPDTRLAQAMAAYGVSPRALLVEDEHLALTARLDMIDAADETIDLQYFIWQNDPSGLLVIKKILAAADRGVRVRALLDDVQLEGLVDRLNALDEHPNIEVRIFNPFSVRMRYRLWLFRVAEFSIDGARLNHRMHNKLLVVDNHLAILGGRNIGDDYFGRSVGRNFIDTDIMLSGPIVPELSSGFDVYWNSRWAYPVNALGNLSIIPDDLGRLRQRVDARLSEHPDLNALERDDAFDETIAQWGEGPSLDAWSTVIDDPDVSWFDRPDEIAADLAEVALQAEKEVLVVAPYLIPTRNLLDIAETLVDRGVRIVAITNSLTTNDVVLAQAAYARYRKRILDMGVELYEMHGQPELAKGLISEEICLHSKYIIVDRQTVFVGSTNLDPRSLYLNTELGVVLESEALVDLLTRSFLDLIRPENAWRVVYGTEGFEWHSAEGVVYEAPAKSAWQRWRYRLLSLLPLQNQL
jgi:putative cardiolipin synthase